MAKFSLTSMGMEFHAECGIKDLFSWKWKYSPPSNVISLYKDSNSTD